MKQDKFPVGWDEERVRRVLAHYEEQTEEEAVAEDEAAFEDQNQAVAEISNEPIPIGLEELKQKQAYFEPKRQYRQKHYKDLERLRQEFVETFPTARIKSMDKDDYVEGKLINGEPNRNTFCYWLEWRTEELGRIQGATAYKFGLYVDKESQEYRFVQRFENADEAIDSIRREIIRLIDLGKIKDLENIKKIELSPMFKGKILFLYFPDDYINVFSENDVDHFLKKIGIYQENKHLHLIDKRELLLKWKNSDPVMEEWNMFDFSDFLYTELGHPPRRGQTLLTRPDRDVLHELVGTLTHKEAEEMRKLIDEEFERVEGEW